MPGGNHTASCGSLGAVDDAKPRERGARELAWLEMVVFAVATVALVLDTGGGPGWGGSSIHTVLGSRLEHVATAPLYDVLASVASLLPAGEPGFRLGVLGALLGAATLTGVVAAVRALVPREPAVGLVAALLVAIAPPFRDAAAFASPTILAACGTAWALALSLRFARDARAADPERPTHAMPPVHSPRPRSSSAARRGSAPR